MKAPIVAAALAVLAGCASGEREQPATRSDTTSRAKPRVVFETTRGRLVIELEPARAPETVENFLLHVRSKFYDGLVFHRVLPNRVVQAGELTSEGRVRTTPAFPIANENPNGLTNVRGAIAMARTSDPHSATSQFYINARDNPEFDFKDSTVTGWGYTVFGQVVEGLDVVDAIASIPTRPQGKYRDMPTEQVVIERAYVGGAPGPS